MGTENGRDWDQWMKEHHVYIPTIEEIEDAKARNEAKIRRIRNSIMICQVELEQMRDRLDKQNGIGSL